MVNNTKSQKVVNNRLEKSKSKSKSRNKSEPRMTVKIINPETHNQKEMDEAFDWLFGNILN